MLLTWITTKCLEPSSKTAGLTIHIPVRASGASPMRSYQWMRAQGYVALSAWKGEEAMDMGHIHAFIP